MSSSKSWITAAVVLSIILASGPTLALNPQDDVLLKQAVGNLEQENYEEALEELTQTWQKGPQTPEKAFYLGLAYRRMLNYPKAREFLEQALKLKPKFPEAESLLADTLMALDKPELAIPYLKDLESIGYQPGPTALLLGTAAFKQKRNSEALDYFRKAQEDPAVAQEAKLQMSLVLAADNRLKEARKTLEEVMAVAPQTETGSFAQRYASLLDRRLKDIRPFRFFASVGFDYDSNVTLQPGDPTAAQQVSGRGDSVYNQTAAMEYSLFPGRPFNLTAGYAYFQNFHRRLTKFDLLSHTWGLVPSYQTENSKLWLPFNYAYSDVENDKYYTAFTVNPTYLYLLTPKVGLEVGTRLARRYYWFPLSIPQDDRSGRMLGGSMGLYYFLKNQEGYLQARASYEHDFTSGSNWSSNSYRLFLMALYPVTPKFKVSTFVDLILQPYNHYFYDGVTYGPKRHDKILIYGAQATYDIYKGLEFNVHYYYVRDDSNTAIYDYDRHIVGCQLGYRY